MNRYVTETTATFGTTAGAATAIPYAPYAGGSFYVPSGTGVTVTWYATADGENFYPAYDADGAAVTQTVTSGRVYPIPDSLYGSLAIKGVGGSEIADAKFCLKS